MRPFDNKPHTAASRLIVFYLERRVWVKVIHLRFHEKQWVDEYHPLIVAKYSSLATSNAELSKMRVREVRAFSGTSATGSSTVSRSEAIRVFASANWSTFAASNSFWRINPQWLFTNQSRNFEESTITVIGETDTNQSLNTLRQHKPRWRV